LLQVLAAKMQESTDFDSRILLADDEDIFLRPTALFLQKRGIICDCVHTVEEAAAALAKTNYDLLVIDINMPGNTNLEFLRDRPQHSNFLPVIVVTGYPTFHTAVESLRLAVVDYQTKPLDLPNFLETIRSAIEKARVVRVMREARKGFGSWLEQIGQMEKILLTPRRNAAEESRSASGELDWYLGETIQTFANLSVSLMNAMNTLNRSLPEGKGDVCRLMHCSRLSAYESGVREAIEVLIKTKNSFKSKELAEIRKKLELLLKTETGRP
jgi:DNA-binding response OmpR family regulator